MNNHNWCWSVAKHLRVENFILGASQIGFLVGWASSPQDRDSPKALWNWLTQVPGSRILDLAVHGHGEPQLKILVEHLAAQGDPLTEHVDGHEAQGFAVHQESVGVDGRKSVDLCHVSDPGLDVLSQPRSRICGGTKRMRLSSCGFKLIWFTYKSNSYYGVAKSHYLTSKKLRKR